MACTHWVTKRRKAPRSSFHLCLILLSPTASPQPPSGERLLTALRGIDKNEKSKWTWNVLVGEHPPLGWTGVLLHSASLHLSGSQFDFSYSRVLVLGRKCRFCPASWWRKSLLFYTYIYFSLCLNAGVSVNAVGDWGQREPRWSDLTVRMSASNTDTVSLQRLELVTVKSILKYSGVLGPRQGSGSRWHPRCVLDRCRTHTSCGHISELTVLNIVIKLWLLAGASCLLYTCDAGICFDLVQTKSLFLGPCWALLLQHFPIWQPCAGPPRNFCCPVGHSCIMNWSILRVLAGPKAVVLAVFDDVGTQKRTD